MVLVTGTLMMAKSGGPPPPPRTVNAATAEVLGRGYAPALLVTYAEAWEAAAEAVVKGATVADAQTVHQNTWKASRTKAFRERLGTAFATVLPEGAEPETPEERRQVAEFWKAFARGLRGAAAAPEKTPARGRSRHRPVETTPTAP